ncbi:MAG: hypothetical protein O7G88_00815 [bacterium]|nr:hypothetical protein [bacterium]
MLYLVECGFADSSQATAWNDWYSGLKLEELLTLPDFLSAQRFRALDNNLAPYLNVTSIASTELFTNPDYRRGGGGSFGPWALDLIIDWRRLLFAGMDEMPAVADDQRLLVLDQEPDTASDLGVAMTWLDGLDWQTATNYADGVALAASVPHRGLAIVSPEIADALPPLPSLRIYTPICPKRV